MFESNATIGMTTSITLLLSFEKFYESRKKEVKKNIVGQLLDYRLRLVCRDMTL